MELKQCNKQFKVVGNRKRQIATIWINRIRGGWKFQVNLAYKGSHTVFFDKDWRYNMNNIFYNYTGKTLTEEDLDKLEAKMTACILSETEFKTSSSI